MLYRGAKAAIIVYDITSVDSFERAKSWVNELQQQEQPVVIVLAGARTVDQLACTFVGSAYICTVIQWGMKFF